MKTPRNDLNDEQRALFDERIRHWQNVLGLNDWRVERSKRRPTAMADMKMNIAGRLATYTTGDFGATAITFESLDSTACHEMLHVMLAELTHLTSKAADAEHLESAEHRVVNMLEKILTAPRPPT